MGNQFDTGYTSEFLSGQKLKIKNRFTDYSEIIDVSEKYSDDCFSNMTDTCITVDSFFEFVPYDWDNDGVFELVAKQYVSLVGHADFIGNAESILKYDSDTQKFEVVKAEFICP